MRTDTINKRAYMNSGNKDEDWKPIAQGITMSVEHIPELKIALDRAYEMRKNQNQVSGQENLRIDN
ncbi:hypothetical protein ACFLRX_00640 [Acidobacteriota bacterium]